MPPKAVSADEEYRREFRTIFAETGHRTLNALLIVSGGAAVSFLTFLGGAVQESQVAMKIGPDAVRGFILAMQLFLGSVACCVVAHGTTYFSHAAYHFRHHRTGLTFMLITVLLGFVCVSSFVYGGYAAIAAFERVGEVLTHSGPP